MSRDSSSFRLPMDDGISPDRKLFDKIRSVDICFRKHEKLPVIWLNPRSNTSNFEQWARDCGIGPSNRFPLRFKVHKSQEVAIVSGIGPERLLFFRFNTSRLPLIIIKHVGIVPEMLLMERSITWTYEALHRNREYFHTMYCLKERGIICRTVSNVGMFLKKAGILFRLHLAKDSSTEKSIRIIKYTRDWFFTDVKTSNVSLLVTGYSQPNATIITCIPLLQLAVAYSCRACECDVVLKL
ncbi:hypothetical protein VNO78_25625 [Psophocarpus tetragonolobus]|uniref:Uncharacterized protein n=1 Tax=Psophocarpus tetragonolobus TaxID=3891 RepID=A0AAN9S7G5_PSOTE